MFSFKIIYSWVTHEDQTEKPLESQDILFYDKPILHSEIIAYVYHKHQRGQIIITDIDIYPISNREEK